MFGRKKIDGNEYTGIRDSMNQQQERRQADIDGEVIEVLSEDDDVQITETAAAGGDNNMRGEEEAQEDEVQITQINDITRPHSVRIPIRRDNIQSTERPRDTRRRISRDEDDDVQLISERPLLHRRTNQHNIDHMLALQHQLEISETGNRDNNGSHQGGIMSGGIMTGAMLSGLLEGASRMSQRIGGRVTRNMRNTRGLSRRRRRQTRSHASNGGNENSDLEQFEIPMRLFGNIFSLNQPAFANEYEDSENAIMERIERSNEQAIGSRFASENVYNRKAKVEKKKIASSENKGYSNDIDGKSILGCELCGVELGRGIPSDFKPDHRYNENLENYAKEYRVNAPWFCIKQCSEADSSLSKRIFISRCGHVFCGRCVKNIGNRPKRVKNKDNKLTIDNPGLYAPRSCPATECGKNFTSKGFNELYF